MNEPFDQPALGPWLAPAAGARGAVVRTVVAGVAARRADCRRIFVRRVT